MIVGQVVHLEVADAVYLPDRSLDLEKARALMIAGSNQGMKFCTGEASAGLGRPLGPCSPTAGTSGRENIPIEGHVKGYLYFFLEKKETKTYA
jgi:hypothetical protein